MHLVAELRGCKRIHIRKKQEEELCDELEKQLVTLYVSENK